MTSAISTHELEIVESIRMQRDIEELQKAIDAYLPQDEWETRFLELISLLMPKIGSEHHAPSVVLLMLEKGSAPPSYYTEILVLAVDEFNDRESRQDLLENIGAMSAHDGKHVVAIAIGIEAWISYQHVDQERMLPSDDPKRKEVWVTQGLSIARSPTVVTQEIHRDAQGCYQSFGEPTLYLNDASMEAPLLQNFWRGYGRVIYDRVKRRDNI